MSPLLNIILYNAFLISLAGLLFVLLAKYRRNRRRRELLEQMRREEEYDYFRDLSKMLNSTDWDEKSQ